MISAHHPLSMHPLGPQLLHMPALTPLPLPLHRPFPAHPIVPPLPYTAGPADNLNPNVPEFVPVIHPHSMDNGADEEEPVDECAEACEDTIETQTEALTLNNRLPAAGPQAQSTDKKHPPKEEMSKITGKNS